jgi:hypothetical protein
VAVEKIVLNQSHGTEILAQMLANLNSQELDRGP